MVKNKSENRRESWKDMMQIFQAVSFYLKGAATWSTVAVFVLSGLYLVIIDGADLKNKGLKRELAATRVIGLFYIFGSIIAFIIFKYIF